ncbi:o-methyltransferase [Botrytis cinerea]
MDSLQDYSELSQTADEISTKLKNFDGNHHVRTELLKKVDKLRLLLEEPIDVVMRQWEYTNVIAALNLLVETKTFETIPEEGSITAKDLAAAVNVDESAIARALRMSVMFGIGEEVESDTFAHNSKSLAYRPGFQQEFFKLIYDHTPHMLSFQKDLYDLTKGPYAYGHGLEGKTYYEAISHTPERLHMFNTTMVSMERQSPITGMYPFATLKNEVEAEKERPFVVDIGGGRGQALVAIQKEAPKGFGAKMILQDRSDVLQSLTEQEIPNIEKMVYDFHTPQPVKNAHVYFIRRILHDFYEPVCIRLLKNIASAMGPTSRVVIADMIRPEKTEIGGELMIYWMDFCMMMLNGKEKSEKEFRDIIDSAGLEIVKIWRYPIGTQAQIECRLKRV